MQHDTSPLSTHHASGKPASQALPFTRYDFGWVLLCIGMAIGAGTVLMPVQIGLKGIWVFITASLIAYPATWIVQDIYLKTCWMLGKAGYRRISHKPGFPGEAQRCGGLIPGGIGCWKEKTPARCLV